MNLQKISEVKDKMELMYNSIYDLQEAIQKKKDKDDIFYKINIEAKELYMSILNLCSTNEEESERLESLAKLEHLITKCSGVTIKQMKAKNKKGHIVLPRQIHMAFMHKTYGFSQSQSGSFYGKDHATTIHASKVIRNMYQTDKLFLERYKPVIDHCVKFDSKKGSTKTYDFLNEK